MGKYLNLHKSNIELFLYTFHSLFLNFSLGWVYMLFKIHKKMQAQHINEGPLNNMIETV